MTQQQGFTLIELMIVVAIIGVLASFALPTYQNSIAKAQAAEALTVTSGIKVDILEAELLGRAYPVLSAPQEGDASLGRYVSHALITNDGDIQVIFKPTGVARDLQNAQMILAYSQSRGWECSWGGASPPHEDLLPSGCK